MNRRQLLKWIGGAGVAGVAGRFALLPPNPSDAIGDPHELAKKIYESFDDEERKLACVPYDHPLRQYHNRGVWGGGLWITPRRLGWTTRGMIVDLFYASLSEQGRSRVPLEYYTRWPGVHSMQILFCGDPNDPPYQVILTGAHLNLRIGGASKEGVAFGGPQVYGDQHGDSQKGLPGNVYRFQLETFRKLGLEKSGTAPIQTQIELQGKNGTFAGTPVKNMSAEKRAISCATR